MSTAEPPAESLLDAALPDREFRGSVSVYVDASPAEVFRALYEVTLRDMPLAYALGTLRYLPGRLAGRTPKDAPASAPFVRQLLEGGTVVLAERPEREVLLGSAGKYHQLIDQEWVRLRDRDEFDRFADPAYQKLAIAIRVEPAERGLRLVLEHRTHPLSEASRRAFAVYWRVIEPMGNFVAWLLLRAVRRRAEAKRPVQQQRGARSWS